MNIVRNGKYKVYQKYKCKNCNRQFSERSFSFFYKHRFPDYVIKNSILYSFFVSTRKVKFLAKETMYVIFSHQTAYNWSKKFAKFVSKLTKVVDYTNIWHVDEKYIKSRNKKDKKGKVKFSYLWVVIDSNNNMIATHVSHRRDIKNAKIILKKAKERARKPPDILVSDGLQAYKRSCKHVFGRKTKHVIRHFEAKGFMHQNRLYYLSNNRIESLNSKINLWYKKFRGFKSIETARLWCEVFNYFYNHMRPRVVEHNIISIEKVIAR
jgi:transposase-like protein